MRIPHKVRITAKVTYRVVYVDRFDNPEVIGFLNSEDKTITILRTLGKKKKLEIFIHELLHAIEHEYDIALPHKLIYKLQEPLTKVLFVLNPKIPARLLSSAACRRVPRKSRRK